MEHPTITAETPRKSVERIIAEEIDGGGWLILWPDGEITAESTKAAAERVIRKRAGKLVGPNDILITRIEWRPL